MNGRSASKTIFLFSLIIIVILLQLLSTIQANRFIKKLDSLEKVLSDTSAQDKTSAGQIPPAEQEYPGDEGDWLVWAYPVEPKTLNLISADVDIYSIWMVFETVLEPLLTYDYDEVKLKPHLAKNYSISPDGLEITFTLRDNIYFSDGVPVTTDDVIFTYQTIINPKIDAANVAQSYVDVKGFERIDDKTVKFLMKRPYFLALEILSFWNVGIYPKHIYDFEDPQEFNKRVSNPIGSGPYVFEKWDTGDKITFRRNENYWGPPQRLKRSCINSLPTTRQGFRQSAAAMPI